MLGPPGNGLVIAGGQQGMSAAPAYKRSTPPTPPPAVVSMSTCGACIGRRTGTRT